MLALHAWLLKEALSVRVFLPATARQPVGAAPGAVLALSPTRAAPATQTPTDIASAGAAEPPAPARTFPQTFQRTATPVRADMVRAGAPDASTDAAARSLRTAGAPTGPTANTPSAEVAEPRSVALSAPLSADMVERRLATEPSAAGPGIGGALIAVALAAPARGGGPPDEPPPRPPPAALLDYEVGRGLLNGSGRLEWRVEGGCYRLRLESRLPVIGNLLTQTSEGCFDAQGLAPARHTERRLRRSERAVSFVRPVDGSAPVITFSASTARLPLRPGAQDRLSWMVQLAARAASRGAPVPGSRIEMDVAGSGGELQPWVFVLQGVEPDGSWRWRRGFEGGADAPAATGHDPLAEVWTDPARHHWPRRVRLTEGSGDPLVLTLQSIQPLPN